MPNILVVIDPDESEHSALNRIKEIPPAADVNYTVVLYLSPAPVMAKKASASVISTRKEAKAAWLHDLVAPLLAVGYRINVEVVAFIRLYEEIIKSAEKIAADVIFKPLRQHSALKRVFYTSTDWNLIRLCPTPLLLVSDQRRIHGKPIVAAIDISDRDEAHRQLNADVMAQAQMLARILESQIHLVYAFRPAVVTTVAADPLAYQITRDHYDNEHNLLVALAEEHGIGLDNVSMREGAADEVLARGAKALQAGVIVLGTVARSGASGLFVGNTAEAVLEMTETDVLVVKGAGFQTPV
ncbi:MAG: universal stress protein [SAR86 cluster bacterium]|uniref:Universal stress protein n=1 Tax=SAR86 cluster bacterium TaxID=2030880 RepID=A0A973A9P5_9GAMM|nr:universal stress protein [SAR86 cluster bacterium]